MMMKKMYSVEARTPSPRCDAIIVGRRYIASGLSGTRSRSRSISISSPRMNSSDSMRGMHMRSHERWKRSRFMSGRKMWTESSAWLW